MKDEIYEYLKSYGFTNEDMKQIEKENTEIFYVNLKDVKDNIEFLLSKELTNEEIIGIIKNNPFMLTDEKNRREYYDDIYLNILKLNNQELKKIIKSNNDAYTSSPIELSNIIKYLSSDYSIENIKKLILTNPQIITMQLEEAKKLVKLV